MQIKTQAKTQIKKIKKSVDPEVKPVLPVDPDNEIVQFVKRNHQAAVDYRKKFKNKWDFIIEQIRCVHPEAWAEKEDWQSKVFIPQQAKKSETAAAYMDKMLFGQKRFFDIQGVEKKDKSLSGDLCELYDVLFDRGQFYFENDFVMHESCDIGTGFIKVLVKPERSGVDFIWRSAYNISFDPSCGYNFYKAKFVCDEYKKTINELVSDLSKPNPLYSKEAIQKVIDAGSKAAQSKPDEELVKIKSIDGTNEITISKDWYDVNIVEYWGKAKEGYNEKTGDEDIKKYRMVDKIIVIVNDAIKIREVNNDYGFIPFFICRVKPRTYDSYGLGFCENTTDLQDLTNSMINLGFDSLKLCSMDIAVVDATKIKDPASINYAPKEVWLVKGDPRQAVLLTRQGMSALGEITRGLTLLDQFDQEASGVLRQAQGAPQLGGGGSETLGEYQAKLAMIDNRFLKVGRFIERDYIEPILKGMFKIVFNPKFFNQNLINRIVGLREVKVTIGVDPMTNEPITETQMQPKLNFDLIAQSSDMAYDFKAVGMTQFSKAIETVQKLKELLLTVVKTPQLMIMCKVDEIFKRTLQAAEIGDYQDLIKSDEEIQKIMNQLYGGTQQPGSPVPVEGIPNGM